MLEALLFLNVFLGSITQTNRALIRSIQVVSLSSRLGVLLT